MTARDYAEKLLTDGTIDEISFEGKTVGFLGVDKYSEEKLFVWAQKPLRFASRPGQTAYSMSDPLISELQSYGVGTVFIADAERQVELSEINTGDVITPQDGRFDNPPEYNQRVVYV